MKKAFVCAFWFLCLFLNSCNYFYSSEEGEDAPIATAYGDYLFAKDLHGIVKSGTNRKDSIKIVSNYIDNWIRKKALVRQAEANLPPDYQQRIQKQMEDYRASLIIYLYEKELIKQKLDTIIQKEELQEYYDTYKDNFKLDEDIICAYYVETSQASGYKDSSIIWLEDITNEEYKLKLEALCQEKEIVCQLEDSAWLSYNDLINYFPITLSFKELVKQKSCIRGALGKGFYTLKVYNYRTKGNTAPINYVQKEIEKTILNKRKLELIKKTHESIYNRALKENAFTIY